MSSAATAVKRRQQWEETNKTCQNVEQHTSHTRVGYLSIIPRNGTELVCNATWRSWTPAESDCEFIFRRCCISQKNNRNVVTRYRQRAQRTRMQNCRQIRECDGVCVHANPIRVHGFANKHSAALLILHHQLDVRWCCVRCFKCRSNTPLNIHVCHLWHRFFSI